MDGPNYPVTIKYPTPASTVLRVKLTLLLVTIFLVAVACASNNAGEEPHQPALSGQPKTAFPMPPLDGAQQLTQLGWVLTNGERSTISSFNGQVLVLDFYATWCLPCRESIPHLIKLQKLHGGQGLAVVGLNVGGPEDRDAVPGFARELNIHYPLGFPDTSLANLLLSDQDAIPQTFILDRQGRLVARYIGFDSSIAEKLDETVRLSLAAP